ncbi:MAG: hypothetical protein JNJ57_01705 [Saprospiraceae bacterium]|nr:hypothetical protein [Saprospiraceae bacterium]
MKILKWVLLDLVEGVYLCTRLNQGFFGIKVVKNTLATSHFNSAVEHPELVSGRLIGGESLICHFSSAVEHPELVSGRSSGANFEMPL